MSKKVENVSQNKKYTNSINMKTNNQININVNNSRILLLPIKLIEFLFS